MDKKIIALEERVAFLEDSLAKVSKAVEEMNLQLVSLMKEVQNLRRAGMPADQADREAVEHALRYG